MKLSVLMITYNHEEFISEAIKGVLSQKTNFDFELVISNDASNDNSDNIIKETIKANSDISINYICRDVNIGMDLNYIETYKICKGEFIATCEGDDYWIDPYKLQKQVDFLEANPDYGLCFTKSKYLKNNVLELQQLPIGRPEDVYELKDLYFYHNFIPTASVLFKRFEMPNWFNNLPYGDLAVYSIVAKNQKIKCLDLVGSVYRIHDNGLWQGKSRRNQVLMGLKFNKKIYSHVDSEIQKIIKLKSIVLMEELIKIEYKNRFFRGVYFRYLKYIYFPN